MSKIHLIHEISTALKMSGEELNEAKMRTYLDDLLSNYKIEAREDETTRDDNEDYIQMYLNAIKVENYAVSTLTNYNYELQRFALFINKPLLTVKTADVRQYLAMSGELMQSTINTKLEMISAFYAWLVREEELIKNPCDKIRRPKTPTKVKDGLNLVELEKVRAACIIQHKVDNDYFKIDVRKRALIETFYSTACRLNELRQLNIEDVEWDERSVVVRGKGDIERRVFLSAKALYYLRMYLDSRDDDCPALFATERKPYRRLTAPGIQNQVKQIKEKSGISKNLTPHVMRHTFSQIALDNGMELGDLQAILGHQQPETTLRYARASDTRKRNAFDKHHVQ